MVKKQIDFDEEHLNWFYRKFGPNASLSWLCNLLIGKFIEVNEVSPEDYAKIGAIALKDEIEDGAK